MTRTTDPLFDQRIADWLEGDPRRAPGQVLGSVLAAIPSTPQRRASRVLWGPTTRSAPIRWSLSAAAVIAVLAVGGAFLVIQRGQPAVVGGPSQTPTIASPTPVASASPSEAAGPSAISSPTVVTARAPSWTATGSMVTPRRGQSATLLADGKVLVAGGENGNDPLASAELYDPRTGTWTPTGSMVNHAGTGFTSTLLPDGKVLVAGGRSGGKYLDSAQVELYDPRSGTWTATGSLAAPRVGHTATLLADGKVLVAGGINNPDALTSAELYDPGTGTWTATGSLGTGRYTHSATLLHDGKVLVAGGATPPAVSSGDLLDSAELYDPVTGSWTYARRMLSRGSGHAATLLPDGRVLVGGVPELYDPATRSWTPTGETVVAWFNGPGVLLAGGGVVALGAAKPGEDNPTKTAAYLFDPGTGSWTAAGKLGTQRYDYTATLLPDGRVLVAGGWSEPAPSDTSPGGLASAELFDPGTWSPSPSEPAGPAPSPTPYAAQPNGSMFAYIDGVSRLWVANGDGTGAHELLPDAIGPQGAPAWSSDGTRLVFTQARDGDTTGASQFYLTDASGSAPQLVDTDCVAPCVRDTDAAFSRDGTRLVFVRSLALPPTSDRPGPGKTPGPTPASVLATIDLVTGHVSELASTMIIDCPMLTGQHSPGVPNCEGLQNRDPGWSADGTQIVFTQDVPFDMNDRSMYGDFPPPPGPALFVVDADGRDLHQISPRGSGDWSPDGARIVFQTTLYHDIVPNPGKGNGYTYTPSSDIYTIRPDGTDLRRLTGDGNSTGPSWTADGRIWFVREGQLWIMDADGGNARQVSVSPQVPLWYVPGRPPMQ